MPKPSFTAYSDMLKNRFPAWARYALLSFASALMALTLYGWLAPKAPQSIRQMQESSLQPRLTAEGAAIENGVDFTVASEMALPTVVHIRSKNEAAVARREEGEGEGKGEGQDRDGKPEREDIERFFFGPRGPQMPRNSSGSGVILSADGYVVTNNHVVQGADVIEVVLNDNRSYTASVVGTDPSTDLALLRIKETGLPFLRIGNSDQVKVGEWVLAVGNPFNLNSTVTAGIVSAKGRNIGINTDRYSIESFLQTDAAVNPGNSGGALINTRGELIGINTAIATGGSQGFVGYSFAIPVNIMQKVVDDLMNFGNVQRGLLGVSIGDVTAELAEKENLKTNKGVYIASVSEGGAAAEAGIKAGDVIVQVGEAKVARAAELQEQVGRRRPGDKLRITLLRGGETKNVDVVLKNKAGTVALVKAEASAESRLLGVRLRELTKDELKELKLEAGVKVEAVLPGQLRSKGVREGFVITHISDQPVRSAEEVNKVLDKRQADKRTGALVEGVYPDGRKGVYGISF